MNKLQEVQIENVDPTPPSQFELEENENLTDEQKEALAYAQELHDEAEALEQEAEYEKEQQEAEARYELEIKE